MQLLEYSDMQFMNLEKHAVVNAFITETYVQALAHICAYPPAAVKFAALFLVWIT